MIRYVHIIDLYNIKGLVTKCYEIQILADIDLVVYLPELSEIIEIEICMPVLINNGNCFESPTNLKSLHFPI